MPQKPNTPEDDAYNQVNSQLFKEMFDKQQSISLPQPHPKALKAEEIWWMSGSKDEFLMMVKAYAIQVAQQALKDAADRCKSIHRSEIETTILQTPIKTD